MIKKIYFRIYQKIIYIASFFLSFKEPILYVNKGNQVVTDILKEKNINRAIIVTDLGLTQTESFKKMVAELTQKQIYVVIYDRTMPNPDIKQVAECFDIYKTEALKGIIAFGGGSPMDLAKALGAKLARPEKSIEELKGLIKIRRRLPVLIAIPTTVGTGSEATLAAVISNRKANEKYAIMDPVLMPRYAILDVENVASLPMELVATTGMDALTHAIEAYIGGSNTKKTKRYALHASRLIFEYLEKAYHKDKVALMYMQQAAYEAGVAFTRAYVGNVHAIAHTFGGFYQVAHGYANAIILPLVLKYYGSKVYKKLSEISIHANIGSKDKTHEENAVKLIERIDELNKKMKIPKYIEHTIKKTDLNQMIEHAFKEANPLYPVPVIFSREDFHHMYSMITNHEV